MNIASGASFVNMGVRYSWVLSTLYLSDQPAQRLFPMDGQIAPGIRHIRESLLPNERQRQIAGSGQHRPNRTPVGAIFTPAHIARVMHPVFNRPVRPQVMQQSRRGPGLPRR